MGEMNTSAISANELVLIMASVATIGVIGGWVAQKLKLPDVVIYLILGVAFGPTFLNLVNMEAFPTANEIILTFGSAFILYEGGREVKLKILNEVKVSVGLLASLGVFITAGIVGLTAHYVFNLSIGPSFLLGATIASTDPAALIPVFKTVPIKNKLKQTVISESAFNDAFGAILFTSILTGLTMTQRVGILATSLELVFMILIGLLVGIGVALIAVGISSDKKYGIFHGYAPIISITVVVFAYEISERFGGSGYMAVFIAGLVYGNKKRFGLWVPDEDYISGVHFRENLATIARMSIFIVLGTHLNLNSLVEYGIGAIIVVLVLMFIARPIVVLICTTFDKKANWSKNEKLFMMWVRETGVIPAALSGIIVSTKVEGYEIISSVVFMTIIITLLVQASTTNIVAKKLDVLEK
ncbi:cation:proton antiporter [Romboutsia lituseburensis]|uniref:Sodium/hydrogen exchanger family protein n=1 Tax=Romboutsia lituseburensis DSM 797 TaxID=1121325 RepID=A0A1G9K5A2_9FIRM|nr:cation:proton antiporter [Romboutsia lituseburensis]CEH34773.1 Transporter, CPA2 [Romboutsia lituseburensis]SDL44957.1 Sodium/hydrogen exchanger family protein [Romboutsia lituseburensis DSM 797]